MTGLGEGPPGDQGERERGGVGGSESGCGTRGNNVLGGRQAPNSHLGTPRDTFQGPGRWHPEMGSMNQESREKAHHARIERGQGIQNAQTAPG